MAQLIFFRIAKLSEPVMSLDSRDTQNTAPEQLSLPNIYGAYEYIIGICSSTPSSLLNVQSLFVT